MRIMFIDVSVYYKMRVQGKRRIMKRASGIGVVGIVGGFSIRQPFNEIRKITILLIIENANTNVFFFLSVFR